MARTPERLRRERRLARRRAGVTLQSVRVAWLVLAVVAVGLGAANALEGGARSSASGPDVVHGGRSGAHSSAHRSIVPHRVLRTTRAVDQLASDAHRLALLYSGPGPGPCIEIWDVSTGTVSGLPATAGRCPGVSADDRPIEITEIALAGERVLWTEKEWNGHTYWNVLSATATRRAAEGVYRLSGGDSSDIRGLRGDGALLVFAAFDPADRPRATLYVARPRGASALRTFPRIVRLASVDRRSIVVGARKGSLEVLSSRGELIRKLDVRVADVSRVALDGARLVVQRSRFLHVYDVHSGKLTRRWPIGIGTLEDAHRGLAVYVTATAVRVIRLSDGRDVPLVAPTNTARDGSLRAQIEAAGVFYAYAIHRTGTQRGYVGFVPYRRLATRLG